MRGTPNNELGTLRGMEEQKGLHCGYEAYLQCLQQVNRRTGA